MAGSSLLRTTLPAWNPDWVGFRVEDKLICLVCFDLIRSILRKKKRVRKEMKIIIILKKERKAAEKKRERKDSPQHE